MFELIDAVTYAGIWQGIGDGLRQNWPRILIPVVAAGAGMWWGRRQARREWAKKEFLRRLNVSLNTLVDGKLLIRTLYEGDLDEVFRNDVAVRRVLAAARKTTAANPILPVDKDESWFLLNSVLNTLSQRFAEPVLRRDAGQPVTVVRYVFCLTSEVAGAARTRKVRAMFVREDTLDRFAGEFLQAAPQLESPNHDTRVRTLRTMAEKRRAEPHNFMAMEICVAQS